MRIGSRFLILIGALLLLGACAQANRVVDATRSAERPNGRTAERRDSLHGQLALGPVRGTGGFAPDA